MWDSPLVWTHVGADILTGITYFFISGCLIFFINKKREEIPFHWLFLLFGVFIFSCGLIHFMNAWTVFYPFYWESAFLKVINGAFLLAVVIFLVPLFPKLLALPNIQKAFDENTELNKNLHLKITDLQDEIAKREKIEGKAIALNEILENSLNEIYIFDAKTMKFIQVNYGARLNLGYEMEELRKFTPLDLKPKITKEAFSKLIEPLKSGKKEKIYFTTDHLRKDGTLYPVDIYLQTSTFQDRKVFFAIIIDITDRKAAEASLRKLSSAIEQSGESMIITNREGIIEYVNPAFTHVTGYSAEDVLGQTPRILKSGYQDAGFYEEVWDTINSGHRWIGKVVDKKKDGSFFPVMLTISPIFDESGDITNFVSTQSDLSQIEDMEQRFHQAQKMEAVGTMVGGIAHNFNNMLAGMTGYLYLAKKEIQEHPETVKKLTHVEEISHHAAEMIQQLLAFARRDIVSIKGIPFTPFIKETMKLLRTSVPENIAMHEYICADDLYIEGNTTQLHQVLANILNNARDALESTDEPYISITLESFHPDAAFIESYPHFSEQSYAHLRVEDNGCGIPVHHLEHLFEPFYTTKDQDRGTGLGLSMVFGAIKTHHGFVEVDSIEGKGSTFHVYIPLLDRQTDIPVATQERAKDSVVGQGELILLADDDQVVREIMVEILESKGYKILQAKDGQEARALFSTHQQDIALALLDVVMPHGGGKTLAKHLREINPDVPVIFLTGYDTERVLVDSEPMSSSEVLTKPVQIDTLNRTIRKLLG